MLRPTPNTGPQHVKVSGVPPPLWQSDILVYPFWKFPTFNKNWNVWKIEQFSTVRLFAHVWKIKHYWGFNLGMCRFVERGKDATALQTFFKNSCSKIRMFGCSNVILHQFITYCSMPHSRSGFAFAVPAKNFCGNVWLFEQFLYLYERYIDVLIACGLSSLIAYLDRWSS